MLNRDGAGLYDRPLQHLTRTTSKDSYGGTSYTFAEDPNLYWGQVVQTSSEEIEELGRIVTKTKATIRVRGWYVSISPLDRLEDLLFSETYIVDSVARGNDEWIVQGHHL